ncbi:glycosyltransferase [Desertivirga xinjiangensis]|uniref:glycosyltransferase n=1 Tax=Desertivirga xinjiangensis TaxID=539206 RepID=UPI00210D38BC|nr:glycosyltransferase [Pedobacter xinjiangensis]
MLLIDATYINQSGGKVLLEYFVEAIKSQGKEFHILLDGRLTISSNNEKLFDSYSITSNEKDRARFYKALPVGITTIFCFANVPPPTSIQGLKVYILFHNTLILSPVKEKNAYSLKQKLLFLLRRYYILLRNRKSYKWIVQTPSMQKKLAKGLSISPQNIFIYPFFLDNFSQYRTSKKINQLMFLYVADGVKQKNHDVLFEAWIILLKKYKYQAELHLTIPENYTALIDKIKTLNEGGLKIINHGYCDKEKLYSLYSSANCLIFPSLAESFGLPLIEAANAGCNIIAADLPYVYDVIRPSATFNPYKAEDLASKLVIVLNEGISMPTEVVVKNEIDNLINVF